MYNVVPRMRQLSFNWIIEAECLCSEKCNEQNGIKNIEWTNTNQIAFTRVDLAKVGTLKVDIYDATAGSAHSVYCLRPKTGRWNNLSWHSLMLLI